MLNPNNLAIILLAFAAGLVIPQVMVFAQDAVNVTTSEGDTEEVPTLAESIRANLQSLIALITAIIALVGLVIKSGILDPWIDKKKQDQFFTSAQVNLATMKKALEDKTLNKFVLDQITPLIPEDSRKKALEVSANIDDQMNATTAQLEYYYEKLKDKIGQKNMDKKVNPDLNTELPREWHNIANDMGPIPNKIGDKVATTTTRVRPK
jgi:FtsZ-interacting cell division protein ZipA